MKNNLPKTFKVALLLAFVIFSFLFTSIHLNIVNAQGVTPAAGAPVNEQGLQPTAAPEPTGDAAQADDGKWVEDPEVTFVGKTGARSGEFLDWTLRNYNWLCVTKVSENRCDNSNNPLLDFWKIITTIVYSVLALFVLVTAFVIIITRGQNLTVTRFVPRFVFVIVLITLSFSLVQFIYQITDIVQGFFLRNNGAYITTKDLLYIGFKYQDFIGYRLAGDQNSESAFVSLLLVRLTAITYYVMTGILLIRKIILWFFIIISPVFPLLLFYKPLRNTAKIWIGEFFRWLLYAPLFAIFLRGLVIVWESKTSIPLAFDYSQVGTVVYPTAINILLGGPGQTIFYNSGVDSNSVNLSDTFALYVVALLMLWVVILLPFLLLKIFLDYINTMSIGSNPGLKHFVNKNLGFLNPPKGSPPVSPQPPGLVSPTGAARSLPFMSHKGAAASVSENIAARTEVTSAVHESTQVMREANLSIPKMRDIARYETSMMSRDASRQNEAREFRNNLTKIANPNLATVPSERQKFTTLRQQLMTQKEKGNPVAASVLNASQASTTTSTTGNKTSISSVAASQIGSAYQAGKAKAEHTANIRQGIAAASTQKASLPNVNKVQQVSLDDYEEVRKLWVENYNTIEPPKDLSGQQMNRSQWIKNDMDRITQAISLLNSTDTEKVNQGMEMVANILPFLLMGGFSKSEVIAYLKAKMEAGKQVMENISMKEKEEDSLLDRTKEQTATKSMTQAAEISDDKPKMLGDDQGPKSIEDNPVFGEEKPDPNKPKL
ncbi:MAG TPA: hypothetical protein VG917_02050 [Patescibacteria group bacterium]|nr:hypothetical protein [Patescibacteria group bacterium]